MKPRLLFSPSVYYLRGIVKRFSLLIISVLFYSVGMKAQCPGGTTAAQLNWDNLDFLQNNTTAYTNFYPNASFPFSQNFAIGPRNLNFSFSNANNITLNGDNGTNTAHSGSFSSAGNDVQFTTSTSSSRTMTLTFDINVQNVQFSMFDLDGNQRLTFTATNSGGTPQNITVTRASASSAITITGSGTATAVATGPSTGYSNSDNRGTINISITGPVSVINIEMSNASGDIWLGDIDACVTGSFPVNYFNNMRPYTGQPTYIIATSDTNTVSLINVATGEAKMIFQDPSSPRYINGLGYDHIRNELYYVHDYTSSPSTNRAIYKYNFNTQAISTVVNDVRTIGIPSFSRGVESAGCAFYDGALYFGIEGNGSTSRETIIWRIDFDGSGNVTGTRQVYGTPNGSTIHDWGDFALADSILADFNSASAVREYTHYNLHTGQVVAQYTAPSSDPPRQTGIIWNNTMYWVYDSIAVYNGNGTIGPKTRIFGATGGDWTGFCGDATGFRPQSDFGDAPSTYDPDPLSPALHMWDTILRLGNTFDQEFVKATSADADGDGADEDGIATVNVLDSATTNYVVDVAVYNNTGSNATLIGWLDINGNGTFEASEGRSYTVPSSTSMQTITVAWMGINTPLIPGQHTFLRIRLTRTANEMTVNNPTGYYPDGEVEDYKVFVASILPVDIIRFDAQVQKEENVKLTWTVSSESGISEYVVERSRNSFNWTAIGKVSALNQSGSLNYSFIDHKPEKGKSYYRLRITKQTDGNTEKYSAVRNVYIRNRNMALEIQPNPAKNQAALIIDAGENTFAEIRLIHLNGNILETRKVNLVTGKNSIIMSNLDQYPVGVYAVQVKTGSTVIVKQLIILKQ